MNGPIVSYHCDAGATESQGPHGWVNVADSLPRIVQRFGPREIEEALEVCSDHAEQLRAEGWRVIE